MPNHWGTDGVRNVDGHDGRGWIFTAVRALDAECAGSACLQSRRPPIRRPAADHPWGLPGCMARPRRHRLGGWPCGWITARPRHLSDDFTNQIKFWGIQPSYAFVASPSSQRRCRAVQSHAPRPWSHLPQHRGVCGTPSATFANSTMFSGSPKRTRYLSPAQARTGVARRFNQPRRVTNLCPEPCATVSLKWTRESATRTVTARLCDHDKRVQSVVRMCSICQRKERYNRRPARTQAQNLLGRPGFAIRKPVMFSMLSRPHRK